VGVDGQADRDHARRAIRHAILAELAAMTRLPAERIALHAAPGRAPYASLDHPAGPRTAGLAISHDGALSVAAIRLYGPVGIDVQRVAPSPDLDAVARAYLGPQTAARLGALAPGDRAAAFARAWSEHEARLKCLGLPLAEWPPADQRLLAACRVLPLTLPEGYAGWLALPPD
jgi:4'-phosphopantetheinyl transferase